MTLRPAAALLPLLFISLLFSSVATAQDASDGAEQNPSVVMRTTMGDIVIQLDVERAPRTVENFLAYVDDNFYADTVFHRVIEGFMIQGGGFTASYQRKATRKPVSNEAYNGLRNRRYTIAMARTTAPHSATSQFFINSENNHNLDHTGTTQRGWGYTVFGRVVQGEDVVDAISRVRTGPGGPFSRDVPVEAIVILDIERWPAVSVADDTPVDASTSGRPVEGAAAANPDNAVIQNAQPKIQNINTNVDLNDAVERVSGEIVKQN